jgi:hypothetical protein
LCCSLQAESPELDVLSDFPGGSADVVRIDQQTGTIVLSPQAHADRGWACWWYGKVVGASPGQTITIDVGDAPWATPDRAMVRFGQQPWRQTEPGTRNGKRMVYRVQAETTDFWIAWGPPFLLDDAQQLVTAASSHRYAHPIELCRTRDGWPVPGIVVSEADETKQPLGIWIQARQHAWESGSSWVAKGLVEWLVSDAPEAQRLRRKAVITVVPIMDVDNVQRGAGGKNQQPQDHNRDWSSRPHWRSVAAAEEAIQSMDQAGRFDLFIDLHNPGAGDKHPYYYLPPADQMSEKAKRNLAKFLRASREQITGPLSFTGKTIESGENYDPQAWQRISKNWVIGNTREHVVAVTLETAWNTPHSTVQGYQQVGRQLGRAIASYAKENPRPVAP